LSEVSLIISATDSVSIDGTCPAPLTLSFRVCAAWYSSMAVSGIGTLDATWRGSRSRGRKALQHDSRSRLSKPPDRGFGVLCIVVGIAFFVSALLASRNVLSAIFFGLPLAYMGIRFLREGVRNFG
jgi:hypothetical protein